MPLCGLTVDVRVLPKEGAKDAALKIQKVSIPGQPKRAKTFTVTGSKDGVLSGYLRAPMIT